MTMYEPAEDSFLLEKAVMKFAFGSVLDMGTGSGIQAKAARKLKKVTSVTAVDMNPDVVTFLKKEKLKGITVKKSDLFSNIKGRFDTIIFNPPYLPLDKREPQDSRLATTGGKHGYETLNRFLEEIDDHLTKKGIGLILFSSLSKKEKIEEQLELSGYDFENVGEMKISFETLYVYKIKRNWLLEKLFDRKVTDVRRLTKGHRGLIYTGTYKGKKIAIKAQRLDIAVRTVGREAKMIKRLNKSSIAPKIVFTDTNYFAYEYIKGDFIKKVIEAGTKARIKKALLATLQQCRTLDKLKITKEEMHNPYKHVIVNSKVTLVDFERAHHETYPKNVTQFCQYILRNHSQLSKKGMKFTKDDLMKLAQQYKKNQTESNYKKIKEFVKRI